MLQQHCLKKWWYWLLLIPVTSSIMVDFYKLLMNVTFYVCSTFLVFSALKYKQSVTILVCPLGFDLCEWCQGCLALETTGPCTIIPMLLSAAPKVWFFLQMKIDFDKWICLDRYNSTYKSYIAVALKSLGAKESRFNYFYLMHQNLN